MPKLILNGIEYANNKPDGFPPIIYSEEEREVGVWKDGKPLYQKVITLSSTTAVSKDTWTTIYTDTLIGNIDQLVNCRYINLENKGNYGYFAYKPVDNNLQVIHSSSGAFTFFVSNKMFLEYTKTTDTPGSGKWSTQGTPTQNYSTTEHVIGTWIDGKPIYEKTINLAESNFTKGNNWHWSYNYENSITNYKEVIKMDGIMRIAWNTYKHIIMLGGDCFADNNSSNYLTFCNYYRHVALKGYPYNTGATSLANVVISFCQLTIRYTKTTD